MPKSVAIYFDNLLIRGGAEKVALQLASSLNADLITSGINRRALGDWIDPDITIIDLQNRLSRLNKDLGVLLETPIRFFLNRRRFHYDINIYIGYNSIYASRKDQYNIWFCLSPNRMLYDLREYKRNTGSFPKRLFFRLYSDLLMRLDQHTVKTNFSEIVAQTYSVKARISKYYSKDSKVIYSPIDTSKYRFKEYGDFYLTVGRLVPEKRIELICRAFSKMPEKKLVVVGDGPNRDQIQRIISNSKGNISLLSNQSESVVCDLYSKCLATIYMPVDEDFGLIPVESMASGKCCIAVNEAGIKETILDGKTGVLIAANEQSLIDTVNSVSKSWFLNNKVECINRARTFDILHCTKVWIKLISDNYNELQS